MIRHISRSLFVAVVAALALSPLNPADGAPAKKKPSSSRTSAKPTPEPLMAPAVFDGTTFKKAASVTVVDAVSRRLLFEKDADTHRPPASTQKLLTSLLVAEAGDLDEPVTIEKADTYAEPVMLYIKPGEVYTRRDLLKVLLVHSPNDVARALARDNAGSVEAFAVKMNRKAALLGMTNSHFVNPNGLPAKGQYSTARDMSRLALAAYNNEVIRSIVCTKVLTFRYPDGRVREFKNTNRVLRGYPYCNGMKTGYTQAAGHCLISSGSNNGREVIVVVLGDDRRVWQDSCSLLAWGLSL